MKLTSSYGEGGRIPNNYANIGATGGQNISPPFEWSGEPDTTKSFALAIVDHHPVANNFVHWVVINIPADAHKIEEGASGIKMPPYSVELNTTYNRPGYGGPRPPAGSGDHPYETTIYALNVEQLPLAGGSTPDDFFKALDGKVIAQASLTGMFSQ